MCIIIVKPAGTELPSFEILEECERMNRDGAGFMFAKDGKVIIDKGYFDVRKLYKSLVSSVDTSLPAVIHFRIATSGNVSLEHCHPYPLIRSYRRMSKTDLECQVGVAHNGVFSITPDKGVNDSMTFISNVLARNLFYKHLRAGKFKCLFEKAIEGNKLALLYNNGELALYGEDWIQDKGIFYSNRSYLLSSYTTTSNRNSAGFRYVSDEDEEAAWSQYGLEASDIVDSYGAEYGETWRDADYPSWYAIEGNPELSVAIMESIQDMLCFCPYCGSPLCWDEVEASSYCNECQLDIGDTIGLYMKDVILENTVREAEYQKGNSWGFTHCVNCGDKLVKTHGFNPSYCKVCHEEIYNTLRDFFAHAYFTVKDYEEGTVEVDEEKEDEEETALITLEEETSLVLSDSEEGVTEGAKEKKWLDRILPSAFKRN